MELIGHYLLIPDTWVGQEAGRHPLPRTGNQQVYGNLNAGQGILEPLMPGAQVAFPV